MKNLDFKLCNFQSAEIVNLIKMFLFNFAL